MSSAGRVFQAGRRVRAGDVDPCGRLRLDALARYLQDVSNDDTDDARLADPMGWVVRRTVIEQRHPARLGERLELVTFCSGYGSRWAERRVSILGDRDASIDAATAWVHVDATGRPKALPAEFHALYDAAAGGRLVNARQTHVPLVPGAPGVEQFEWHPRATDLDVLDHVNNSVAWAVVEQLRTRLLRAVGTPRGSSADPLALPFRAEVEFRDAIDREAVDEPEPLVAVHRSMGGVHELTLWSSDRAAVHVTARLQPLGESTRP
jgi:acyl-ACP thioesterase